MFLFLFLFLFLFFAVLDYLCDNDDGNLTTICEFRSELPSSNPVHLTLPGGTARLCRQAYSFSPCISLIFFYAFCSLFLLNFCLSIFFQRKTYQREGEEKPSVHQTQNRLILPWSLVTHETRVVDHSVC